MPRTSTAHAATFLAALAAACAPVAAQQEIQVVIDRSLTDDPPYTTIYPDVLETTDDGNPQTILTLQHPGAPMQCNIFVMQGAPTAWSPEEALSTLDVARIEANWSPSFPGFRLTGQSVTRFANVPALLYEGTSDGSPFGVPVSIVHAESVDGPRTYIVQCLLGRDVAAGARTMVDFIIANFSTTSDGTCCIDPRDDRG